MVLCQLCLERLEERFNVRVNVLRLALSDDPENVDTSNVVAVVECVARCRVEERLELFGGALSIWQLVFRLLQRNYFQRTLQQRRKSRRDILR